MVGYQFASARASCVAARVYCVKRADLWASCEDFGQYNSSKMLIGRILLAVIWSKKREVSVRICRNGKNNQQHGFAGGHPPNY